MVKKKVQTTPPSSTNSEITELLLAAENCLSDFLPDELTACALLKKAFDLNPNDWKVTGALGDLLCNAEHFHVRNEEEGIALLMKSLKSEPSEQLERYFSLGQALANRPERTKEAEECYNEGIRYSQIDYENLNKLGKIQEAQFVKRQIARACCAIAELYLTDLCDEDTAEDRVVKCLNTAITLDPESFDGYAGLTAYRKTVGKIEEAIESGVHAFNIYQKIKKQSEESDEDIFLEMPEWNSRLGLAASLVDLEQTKMANEILEQLIAENDGDVQAWHLMTCSHIVEKDFNSAEECLENAKKLLERAQSCDKNAELSRFIEHWTKTLFTTDQKIRENLKEIDGNNVLS